MQQSRVQVLMSSYNGEKYIEDQINSILNQKGVEVSILIRDDGSSDSTRRILQKVESEHSNIHCLFEENIGVKKSFLKLIFQSDENCEFYAFSDQDDVWQEDKLITAVESLRSLEAKYLDKPLIYGSSVYLYSENKVVGKQFMNPELQFGNFLIKNYYPGCTMVFNSKLRKLINSVDYDSLHSYPLHDHWLNLVCTACGGKVVMDKIPHILYRQHNNNVVGDRTLIQKVRGNGLFGSSSNTRFKICQELDQFYRGNENETGRKLTDIVLNYKHGLKNRITLALNRSIKPISNIEKISIFFIVLMKKF